MPHAFPLGETASPFARAPPCSAPRRPLALVPFFLWRPRYPFPAPPRLASRLAAPRPCAFLLVETVSPFTRPPHFVARFPSKESSALYSTPCFALLLSLPISPNVPLRSALGSCPRFPSASNGISPSTPLAQSADVPRPLITAPRTFFLSLTSSLALSNEHLYHYNVFAPAIENGVRYGVSLLDLHKIWFRFKPIIVLE